MYAMMRGFDAEIAQQLVTEKADGMDTCALSVEHPIYDMMDDGVGNVWNLIAHMKVLTDSLARLELAIIFHVSNSAESDMSVMDARIHHESTSSGVVSQAVKRFAHGLAHGQTCVNRRKCSQLTGCSPRPSCKPGDWWPKCFAKVLDPVFVHIRQVQNSSRIAKRPDVSAEKLPRQLVLPRHLRNALLDQCVNLL